MLSLPHHPRIDKDTLIGGCVRLPVPVDARRIAAEVLAIPQPLWGDRGGGRIGVHRPAEAIFLRGFAPADGELPVEDRDALQSVPAIRELIEQVIPASPLRCLIAKLRAGSVIAPHVDLPDYFAKTIRLHFPIVTHPSVRMFARGLWYHMQPGEAWALNNSNLHAVVNGWDQPRVHVICDFLPSPELLRLLSEGEHDLGRPDPQASAMLAVPAPH